VELSKKGSITLAN
jgi:hypothetical protein